MIRFIFLMLFITINTIGYSQDADTALSNGQIFNNRTGTLIKREYIRIGKIKKVELSVVKYTDLIDDIKWFSLKFTFDKEGVTQTFTKTAYLDYDEIIGLIKSIEIIQEKIFKSIPANYSEITFKTRGGFEAGTYWSDGGIWRTYLKLVRFDDDSYIFLEKEDFPGLLNLLNLAKSMISN